MLKPLTVWITTNRGKFLKEMGIPNHFTCLLRNMCAGQEATVRIGHGKMDWFKTGKGVPQGCILLHAYLTYIPSRSCKMPGLMNHKLKSRFPEVSTTSKYADDTALMAESEEKLKSLLMNMK